LTQKLYDAITGIQLGIMEGPEGLAVEVKLILQKESKSMEKIVTNNLFTISSKN